MKGKVFKKNDGLSIRYDDITNIVPLEFQTKEIPLYFDEYYPQSLIDTEVEFVIVDEFTHPHLFKGVEWGDGIKYAKLTSKN
jgi:hypothetical protein